MLSALRSVVAMNTIGLRGGGTLALPRSSKLTRSFCLATTTTDSSLARVPRVRFSPAVLPRRRHFALHIYSKSWRSASSLVMASSVEKTVLVPVANGTEEMEAVITIDVLRRAGAQVTVASIEDSLEVKCSRGVRLVADVRLSEILDQDFDLVALPGGAEGAERFGQSKELAQMLLEQSKQKKLHAAICASPAVVLEPLGLLKDRKATSHPAFVDRLSDPSAAERRVIVDGQLTTSRGPGTAFEFALSLVEQLFGSEKMKEVANPMVMYSMEQKVAQVT